MIIVHICVRLSTSCLNRWLSVVSVRYYFSLSEIALYSIECAWAFSIDPHQNASISREPLFASHHYHKTADLLSGYSI